MVQGPLELGLPGEEPGVRGELVGELEHLVELLQLDQRVDRELRGELGELGVAVRAQQLDERSGRSAAAGSGRCADAVELATRIPTTPSTSLDMGP